MNALADTRHVLHGGVGLESGTPCTGRLSVSFQRGWNFIFFGGVLRRSVSLLHLALCPEYLCGLPHQRRLLDLFVDVGVNAVVVTDIFLATLERK